MQHRTLRKCLSLLRIRCSVAFIAGCKKQVASAPPAPPPAPGSAADGDAECFARCRSIRGRTVTLSWSSTNATDLDIEPGVGKVAPQGSTPVNPTESTTYTITATGSGGTATASARVDVNAPERAGSTTRPSGPPNVQELFDQNVKDAFFDLDKSDLRADAREALTKDAEFLRSYPQVRVSHRRPLRRARLNRIQPGPGPAARRSGEEFPDLAGHHRRPRSRRSAGAKSALSARSMTKAAGSRTAARTS